jgi:predicted ATP-grasp superfamily ATP-dependent carboligase
LTAARALAARDITVYMLASPEYQYLLASRAVIGRIMPDIRHDPMAWLGELHAIAEGGEAVVLCGSDAASEWVTAHRAALPTILRTFESEDRVHAQLMDKLKLYQVAAEAGIRTPWMRHVTTRAELGELLDELLFPCALKPRLGHVAKDLVGAGTVRVDSRQDAWVSAGALLDHGVPVLLTELVPGPETALEGAVTVRDSQGRYVLEYGRRKVRQWPLDYGVGSLTESADVPETLKLNRRLLDHVGFVGVSGTETKRHALTGELYLIETNVRIVGSFGLAEVCGVDGAWRLVAALAGVETGPQPRQVNGRKVMLPQKDLQAAWARIRAGQASVGEILRSWKGTRDFGAFAWRDPAPAWAQIRQVAGTTGRGSVQETDRFAN